MIYLTLPSLSPCIPRLFGVSTLFRLPAGAGGGETFECGISRVFFTREKIDRASDTSLLCLHKEGIFYKLYNQHAMLFTENIKPLKINVKFIKAVAGQVYSCGFPVTIIEDVKRQLCAIGGEINESEKLLTVADINWEKKGDYSKWCKEHKQEEIPAEEKKSGTFMTTIEKQIVGFQVMRRTPMEAMDFILELQEQFRVSTAPDNRYPCR